MEATVPEPDGHEHLLLAGHRLSRPAGIGLLNLEVSFPAVGSTAWLSQVDPLPPFDNLN
jgi:hypothetical protein